MSISQIISLLSGVALFLFGMSLMGDGLKKFSGSRLEPILYRLSNTIPRGVLLGTGVTAVIQSSSATAVMTVGFVNSGMMKVRQGIGIILGAILGTSITGWVICLSYIEGAGPMAEIISTSTLTGLVAVAGIIIRMAAKKQTTRYVGDIMMGFAVLMFGMSTMSGAVSGLGSSPTFISLITTMSNPLLGMLVGALFTAVLQSASAAVGIVQALSVTGAIHFDSALPLLMGISIGASVPVLFSAIGANREGRRTAFSYPVATTLGAAIVAAIFYIIAAIVRPGFMSMEMDPFSIAFVNTLLRLAILLILMPFTDVLEAIVKTLVPVLPSEETTEKASPEIRLEERFIPHPALAIAQCRMVIGQMAEASERALNISLGILLSYREEDEATVKKLEEEVDAYEDSLGTYLVKITGREMKKAQRDEASLFLHTLSDFERMSDHALNLAGNAHEIQQKSLEFSAQAAHELEVLSSAVSQVASMTVTSFRERDLALASRVEPLVDFINDLCTQMKNNHVSRLQAGICTITQGFVFNDIVTNCERIADHCSNVAVAMIELSGDTFQTHEYLHVFRREQTERFQEAYNEYAERFTI